MHSLLDKVLDWVSSFFLDWPEEDCYEEDVGEDVRPHNIKGKDDE